MQREQKFINGVKHYLIRPFITTSFSHGGFHNYYHVKANIDCWLPEERAESFVNSGKGVYIGFSDVDGGKTIRNLSRMVIKFNAARGLSKAEIQAETKRIMDAERRNESTQHEIHACFGSVPQRLDTTEVDPLQTLALTESDLQILSENSKFVDLLKTGVIEFVR